MKKILTILAASAMFFAFGEGISNGINFEAYTTTGEGSFNPLGDDPGTESQYWYSASSVGNVISNHVEAPELPQNVTVPDMFTNDVSNTKFLYLETESPLFRTVKTNGHDPASFEGVPVTESPIYLDTLVKFTAADSAFTQFEDDADKIAIEYVEHEEESHEDPEGHTNIVDSVGFTNFVIRAGYIDNGSIVQTNYRAIVPEGFDKDAWHRLTVRSIANIDGTGEGKGHVGFVVYLDQVPLKYATSVAVGDAAFEGSLNADVKKNFYNGDIHALYPSAVDPIETTGQTISAVAFSGNGSVDDVVFTTTKPGFINESSIVTVTWDAHVATLKLNNESVEGFVAGEAGSTTIEPDNGAVLVDVTFASGWEAGTFTTDGAGSWDSESDSFIDLSSGDTCNIVSMFPYFEVNGQKYDDLEKAIAEAEKGTSGSPATLKLLSDVSKSITIANEAYVIIDLNGKTITGDADSGAAIVNGGATLTITNSSETVGHVVPYDDNDSETEEFAVLLTAQTATYITAGSFDGSVGFDGFDTDYGDVFVITGGRFLDENAAGVVASFYLKDYVAQGDVTADGDYFQVGGGDTPQPTTYALTITVADHTSATYKIGEGEATAYTEVVQVAEGSAVVITATPDSGYTYTGVVLGDGWSLDGESGNATYTIAAMGEATTVVVPNPEAVVIIGTYEVVVTPDANATYAAICTNDDSAVVFNENITTVRVGYAIMITATPKENYEYATTPDGWTAGQAGVITKVVDAAGTVAIPAPTAKSSYPSYITGHDDYKSKYDTWAGTYGADTGSAYEAAFLLNVAPGATDPELKPTAITMEGGKVVITANQTLTSVNGKVYVKVATTLAGLSTAEWAEATLSEGKVQVTPGSSDTAGFYKIKVDF